MSYPSPYLKTKFKMNYATGSCELVKESIEEKAKKYDELIDTINSLEAMYENALEKYPSLTPMIQEKLTVLKLIKL